MAIRSAADSAFGARTATSLNRMRRGARRARGRRARGILGDHKRDLMLRVAPQAPTALLAPEPPAVLITC